MKTINKISVMILLVLMTSFTSNALTGKDTTDLRINGRLLRSLDNIKVNSKCKVLLYNENKLIDSVEAKWRKPFEFKLMKNVWYTIKVSGEDLVPIMISFNTNTGDVKDVQDIFYFDVELHSIDKLPFMNKNLMEFPIGHVKFNKENKRLEASENYTANFLDKLFIEQRELTDLAKK
jgi:hypothetical protein